MHSVHHSKEIPDFIANALIRNMKDRTRLSAKVIQAQVVQDLEKGQVKFADVKDAKIGMTNHGLGVFEDARGQVWWLEGDTIFRQDDSYVEKMIEAWRSKQS
jgi:hypothetical protein